MVITGPGERLLGRRSEREVLDRLLDAARVAHGGVLVVHGDPGVGKTAVLEYRRLTTGWRATRMH